MLVTVMLYWCVLKNTTRLDLDIYINDIIYNIRHNDLIRMSHATTLGSTFYKRV